MINHADWRLQTTESADRAVQTEYIFSNTWRASFRCCCYKIEFCILDFVVAWFGKSTMLSNLFRYVIILWSMNVFSLTYFAHRFHPIIVTLSEKSSFAKYFLLWKCQDTSFLACSLSYLPQILKKENILKRFDVCKIACWLSKLARISPISVTRRLIILRSDVQLSRISVHGFAVYLV